MTTKEIRKKYLEFFRNKDHTEISPSPLIIDSDPTTLFTSSGMQQMVPYLKGDLHPAGARIVDVQPCIRLQDIEEVGDNRHTTFFEMLGNWSLGDYFKKDQFAWVWEFYTKVLGLTKERLHVTVFAGDSVIPKDTESEGIWKSLGVEDSHIHFYPATKNWWSRAGVPSKMPAGEVGGPDSELFYEFPNISHNPEFGDFCHPNCDCGKFMEIGNSVFMQFVKNKNGSLSELPKKNVDFGGGLERVAAALIGDPDIYKIDSFAGVIEKLEKETGKVYGADPDIRQGDTDKSFRVIADHLRASVNLLAEGIVPANKLQGYVLRRLIRRAMFHFHLLGSGISGTAVSEIAKDYKRFYPNVEKNWDFISENLTIEATKFEAALKRGLAKLTKAVSNGIEINGDFAFDLYQTEGFPFELTLEILKQNGIDFNETQKNLFESEFQKHKDASRSASSGMFKGGLAEAGEITTKLHTVTHLLHSALREILGEHVGQKGSHITAERLRFDFSYTQKLNPVQLDKVETLINQKIEEDLPVTMQEMDLQDAIKMEALHFFAEKYGEEVKVYTIGGFSREICGGPHVTNTGAIGRVKIIKQEKVGSGIVRIYATLN